MSGSPQHTTLEDKIWAEVSKARTRPSGYRKQLVRLMCTFNIPKTAEEIRKAAEQADLSVSPSVIYRFLEEFSKINIITRINQGHRKSYFSLTELIPAISLHVAKSGQIIVINDTAVEECLQKLAAARGLKFIRAHIELWAEEMQQPCHSSDGGVDGE